MGYADEIPAILSKDGARFAAHGGHGTGGRHRIE